jgi:hypothetical protein
VFEEIKNKKKTLKHTVLMPFFIGKMRLLLLKPYKKHCTARATVASIELRFNDTVECGGHIKIPVGRITVFAVSENKLSVLVFHPEDQLSIGHPAAGSHPVDRSAIECCAEFGCFLVIKEQRTVLLSIGNELCRKMLIAKAGSRIALR